MQNRVSDYLFKKHDDAEFTSLQGKVHASYAQLVSLFGKHHYNDGYKTDAEWCFYTPFGTVTIYNYKTGRNYCGKNGTPIRDITDWHVGGNDKNVYYLVHGVIAGYNNAIINK